MRACDLAIASSLARLQGGLETSRQPGKQNALPGGERGVWRAGCAGHAGIEAARAGRGLWRAFLVRPRRPTGGDSSMRRERGCSPAAARYRRAMKPLMTGEGGHDRGCGTGVHISRAAAGEDNVLGEKTIFQEGRHGAEASERSVDGSETHQMSGKSVRARVPSTARTRPPRRCSGPPDRPGDAAQAGEKDPQDRAHHRKFHASSLREGARGR